MKLIAFKTSLVLLLPLFLTGCCGVFQGCSVDHTGIAPMDIEGQVYDVNCRVVIDHLDESGVPLTSEDFPTGQVCANGAPAEQLMIASCTATVDSNLRNYESAYPSYSGPTFVEPVNATLIEGETCQLPSGTDTGSGEILSRMDMLISSETTDGSRLLNDETGQLLGKNSLNNSFAVLIDSEIEVGAKFLKWRYANTGAQGNLNFDRFNCNEDNECDLVLRHISLEFDDFTIVRPTVFARDVPVRDARLYSIKNYATRVDSDGNFNISGIDAVITSLIDGESVNLLSGRELEIQGQFANNLHDQVHAALTLKLTINHENQNYSLKAKANFQVRKFPSKLANGKDAKLCLTGGARTNYREARVTGCDYKRSYQVWSFDQKGRYLRIRQPHTSSCLNVKSESQNYDGGIVSIVNCSDHFDQLWAVDHDYNVVNLHTRKCLDVGGNKNRPEDDLVTVHTCNIKDDSQNWAMRKPD